MVLEEFVAALRTLLTKRGYLGDDADPQGCVDDDALHDREPVRCAVTGAPPAGPTRISIRSATPARSKFAHATAARAGSSSRVVTPPLAAKPLARQMVL